MALERFFSSFFVEIYNKPPAQQGNKKSIAKTETRTHPQTLQSQAILNRLSPEVCLQFQQPMKAG